MQLSQNIYFSILLIFIYSCQNSDNGNKQTTNSEVAYLPVYSQSEQAIELYRKAENNIFELEFPEARKNYLAALEIDPNFPMVKYKIRETDPDLKKTFIDSANKFVKSNPDLIFESTMIKRDSIWKSDMDWDSKRESISILMDKLIQEYPNNFEAYLISGKNISNKYQRPRQTKKKSIEHFYKAIELAPNNPEAYHALMEYKYVEQLDILDLKSNTDKYNEFDNELSDIVKKFPDSPRILSTASKLYSNAYNLKDDVRREKAINLGKQAVEVASKKKSSSLNLYYRSLAGVYSNCGLVSESEQTLNLALDNYVDDSQLINTYFDLFRIGYLQWKVFGGC
jgi:tetratricopeptide (TPR) repeat protein